MNRCCLWCGSKVSRGQILRMLDDAVHQYLTARTQLKEAKQAKDDMKVKFQARTKEYEKAILEGT